MIIKRLRRTAATNKSMPEQIQSITLTVCGIVIPELWLLPEPIFAAEAAEASVVVVSAELAGSDAVVTFWVVVTAAVVV